MAKTDWKPHWKIAYHTLWYYPWVAYGGHWVCQLLKLLQQSPAILRIGKNPILSFLILRLTKMRYNKFPIKQRDLCIIKLSCKLNFHLMEIISISLNVTRDKYLNYTSFLTNWAPRDSYDFIKLVEVIPQFIFILILCHV